jgi:hypothetical protein
MIQTRGRRDALTKNEAVGHQRFGSLHWDVACAFPTTAEPEVVEGSVVQAAEIDQGDGAQLAA